MSSLFLIGMGPGDLALFPAKGRQALAACTDVIGYNLYIELLTPLLDGKQRHELPLGAETERARMALNIAAQGRTTALISSGDIGIYAMAAVVFELLDRQLAGKESAPAWLQLHIEIIPGISAMQMAASRVGAPLGHDFCAISLSDLLTPWDTIEARINAAGLGDFVVTFYNPVSRQRDWQLNAAKEILLRYRPTTTPVILGRNLARADESIRVTTLADLDSADVDMLTVVIVGNSTSRQLHIQNRDWVYTPRGYGYTRLLETGS